MTESKCHHQYEFTCKSTGNCIPTYDVCNTFIDCDDKSDEANCSDDSNNQEDQLVPVIKTTTTPESVAEGEKQSPSYDFIADDKDFLSIKDDYDIYSLIQKQKNIVSHLSELERLQSELKEPAHRVKGYETPKDFLDSFFKTNPPARATRFPVYVPTTKETISYKPTRVYWNGMLVIGVVDVLMYIFDVFGDFSRLILALKVSLNKYI